MDLRQTDGIGQLDAYVVVGLGLPAASSAKNVYRQELGVRSGPLGMQIRRLSGLRRLRVAPSAFGRGRDAKAALYSASAPSF